VNCPNCGTQVVCGSCGTPIEQPSREMIILEEMARRTAPQPAPSGKKPGDQTFLVVARGHQDLLDELKHVVGDVGWVRVIEDRRDDPTILPREGRQGTVFVNTEIKQP